MSTTQQPPPPPAAAAIDENKAVVGLENLHNTCYLNSVLQCLMRIEPLTLHVSTITGTTGTMYHCDDNNNNNSHQSTSRRPSLLSCYASFLQSVNARGVRMKTLQSSKSVQTTKQGQQIKSSKSNSGSEMIVPIIRPTKLLHSVKSSFPLFDNFHQHDPHEFCYFFINALHEQFQQQQKQKKKQPIIIIHDNHTSSDVIISDKHKNTNDIIQFWKNHLQTNNSIIVDQIQGLLQNNLQCPNCYNTSILFDIYSILSLPIPQSQSSVSIQDCLHLFSKSHQLDDFNTWKCDKCKQNVNAKQSSRLCSIPNILILHLQRFQKKDNSKKNSQHITFPIDDALDMKPFIYGPLSDYNNDNNNNNNNDNNNDAFQYKLFGVCNHEGEAINSGHYTAIVRNTTSHDNSSWYKCNDSQVDPIQNYTNDYNNNYNMYNSKNHNNKNSTPYLLFYEKVNKKSKWGGLDTLLLSPPRSSNKKNMSNKKTTPPVIDEDGFTLVVSKKKSHGKMR